MYPDIGKTGNESRGSMRVEYCGVSDKGEKRDVNQDAIFMDARENMALFAVADGMGGYQHGEAASGAIVAEMRKWWEELSGEGGREAFDEMAYMLKQRLELANRIIYEKYNASGICGSTVVVLFIYGRNYCIYSSGDSRIYYLSGWIWKQLTVDDVWENQPEISSGYSKGELKQHVNYGKLLHAIGISESMAVNGKTDLLKSGDCFLLCSDGLYKMCREKDMKKTVRDYKSGKDGQKLLEQLLQKVYENGARDNVSIVMVRWKA